MLLRWCRGIVMIGLMVLMSFSHAISDQYKIGPGDILEISVWKNAELSREVVVVPDNTIRYPLIGKIKVGGQSADWLEEILKLNLEKYISEPVLSVAVNQTSSMVIYIIGKVNKPGRYGTHNHINVLQGLASAGGLNPFAKEKEIKIFRKDEGLNKIFNFNYDAVSEGKNLEQNITLLRGDVIVVR